MALAPPRSFEAIPLAFALTKSLRTHGFPEPVPPRDRAWEEGGVRGLKAPVALGRRGTDPDAILLLFRGAITPWTARLPKIRQDAPDGFAGLRQGFAGAEFRTVDVHEFDDHVCHAIDLLDFGQNPRHALLVRLGVALAARRAPVLLAKKLMQKFVACFARAFLPVRATRFDGIAQPCQAHGCGRVLAKRRACA